MYKAQTRRAKSAQTLSQLKQKERELEGAVKRLLSSRPRPGSRSFQATRLTQAVVQKSQSLRTFVAAGVKGLQALHRESLRLRIKPSRSLKQGPSARFKGTISSLGQPGAHWGNVSPEEMDLLIAKLLLEQQQEANQEDRAAVLEHLAELGEALAQARRKLAGLKQAEQMLQHTYGMTADANVFGELQKVFAEMERVRAVITMYEIRIAQLQRELNSMSA